MIATPPMLVNLHCVTVGVSGSERASRPRSLTFGSNALMRLILWNTTPSPLSKASPSVKVGSRPLISVENSKSSICSMGSDRMDTASMPKSTPRSGIPAGTASGSASALLNTMVPVPAESRSPSRNPGAFGNGAVPSVENQISTPNSLRCSIRTIGSFIKDSLPSLLTTLRNLIMLSRLPSR